MRASIWVHGMGERVSSARALGPAQLPGHRLILNKPGVDGSAKANVEPDSEGLVWGVAYEVPISDFVHLDRYEVGYTRSAIRVYPAPEVGIDAEVYVALRTTSDGVPFDWYKQLMLEGAREHGLPGSYVEQLLALPERRDERDANEST